MEINKLTICRQDVIVVSDTETELNEVKLNKKKRCKRRKTKCVRNVKMTTMIVNRIVPFCYRQRCRNGQHYHRQTSMNTKYQKRNVAPTQMNYKKNTIPAKKVLSKSAKNEGNINMVQTKDVHSPITVESSSNTYEDVSSCSFNILSSDSDELEDLINLTRKRMKNDNENFNNFSLRKYAHANITQDDYQNISSDDEVPDSSIHSMDTVILYDGDTMASHPRSPEHLNQIQLRHNNNNNIDPVLLYGAPNFNSSEFLQQKIPSMIHQDNNNLSPLYEISGKVFMEHYLNSSFI